MTTRTHLEWSKSYPCKPQDNIISHQYAKSKPFIPSYEKTCCPINMKLLLSWEYARVWEREHDAYICARKKSEKSRILKRKPAKGALKTTYNSDRLKRRSLSSQIEKKTSKLRRTTFPVAKQVDKRNESDLLNYGNVDTLPVNLQPSEMNPIDKIACHNIATKNDMKPMTNECSQHIPPVYIDPNQYLGGVPIEGNER